MVLRRSIRMVVPRSLSDRTALPRAGCSSPKRTGRTNVEDDVGLHVRKLYRWIRPCFSAAARSVRASALAAAWPDGTPPFRFAQAMLFNAPTRQLEPFWLVFGAPEASRIQGRQARHPLPRPAGGVVILEPFRERPAGPKHTRAEQDRKLGRLHRARQGLVRVPESNTKYGGKSGKTGGLRRSLLGQVSVSPQGFPREKIVCDAGGFRASARCSQGNYLLRAEGLPRARLTGRYGQGRAGMPARRWPAACDNRQGAADSHRLIPT